MESPAIELRSPTVSVSDAEQAENQELNGILILLQDLTDSVRKGVEMDCLETAICSLQHALDNGAMAEKSDLMIHRQMIRAQLTRYGLYGWVDDLESSTNRLSILVGVQSEKISEFFSQETDEDIAEVEIAAQLIKACRSTIDLNTLNNVVCIATEALLSYSGHGSFSHIASLHMTLGKALVMKYMRKANVMDLNQAIQAFQRSESVYKEDASPSYVYQCLISLSHIQILKALECGETMAEIQVSLYRLSEHWTAAEEVDKEGMALSATAATIVRDATDDVQLQEGISLFTAALHHHPRPHPRRLYSLNSLGAALYTRFGMQINLRDLDECINLFEEALELRTPPYPNRSESLSRLGVALATRFQYKGSFEDLERCIALQREALYLLPRPNSNVPTFLSNLAMALWTRFERIGRFEDLEECVVLNREGLDLLPPQDPHRFMPVNNLAVAIYTRFKHKGVLGDLKKSISLSREALHLLHPSDPKRCAVLNNLALALMRHYNHKGTSGDLAECISLHREAVNLLPSPNLDRSMSLNNLGNALYTRFIEKNELNDLEECIALYQEVLHLRPPPHPNRSMPRHNLARALHSRFLRKGTLQDLTECITLYHEALDLQASPHPDRSMTLNNLAEALRTRFEHEGTSQDIETALGYFKEAAHHSTGSFINRLDMSKNWATCARKHRPGLALDAYNYSMELLPHLASVDLTIQQRQDALQHSQGLVGDAAKCAIDANQHELAIIFLSTGRSIFWSQALQLRTTVDNLKVTHPTIAERFMSISKQLEHASYSRAMFGAGEEIPIDSSVHQSLHVLAFQRQQTIKEIQTIPGYKDFLLPPSFSFLNSAARNGPIILLNASARGCDALVLHSTRPLEYIPLSDIRLKDVEELKNLIHTLFDAGLRRVEVSRSTADTLWKLLGRDMVLKCAFQSNDETLRLALQCLWVKVVRPLVNALDAKKLDSPGRIWWCPTGPFVSLPLHAAGIYSDNNEAIDCFFHYAVSSYCTCPQDLLHHPPQVTESFKMMAIIEPEAPNAPPLPATREELRRIQECIPDQQNLIAHVGSKDAPNQVDDLIPNIRQSSIVHFGCHGMQSLNDPLESCLLLSGGKCTMSKIIKDCQVPEGALAYLSACETAKGDEARWDESLNLVATMMFAGFRSVVGTLWSIMDEDAPVVADVFYRHLFRNGRETPPDVRDAAYGLHLATKELRDRGKPFYSWVPYVHYGI